MAYAKTVLNRKNYKPKRAVRAQKDLKQLAILSLQAASSSELSFNQIQAVLKKSLKLHVSNFVLKRALHQLRESGHVKRRNGQYVSTGKRLRTSRNSRKLLSRKARRRTIKQAIKARKEVKKQVSGVLKARHAVLEKLILKSIRALKRQHTGNQHGFYFQSIKAAVKRLAKHKAKKLRNVVIVKALESLRASGRIVLKRGKNYLAKSGKSKNKPNKKSKKKNNKSEKSKKLRIKVVKQKKSKTRNTSDKSVENPSSQYSIEHLQEIPTEISSSVSSLPISESSDISKQMESVISKQSSRFTEDLIKTSLQEAQKECEVPSSDS